MKNLLFILFTLFIFNAQAQKEHYEPMLGDSNRWYVNVSAHGRNIEYEFDISSTVEYSTKQDTLINNITYKKAYLRLEPYDLFEMNIHSGLLGFIREDTVAQKVYFWNKDSSREMLIYDFTLQSGDSFYLPMETILSIVEFQPWQDTSDFKPRWYKVSKREADSMGNIRLTFEVSPYLRDQFIFKSGLGSFSGPLYFLFPYPIGTFGYHLINFSNYYYSYLKVGLTCAYKNGKHIYGNGICKTAFEYKIPSFIEANSNKNVLLSSKLLPNQLSITSGNALRDCSIKLYDISGRLCLRKNNMNVQKGETIKIPVNQSLPAGIYLLQITSTTTNYTTKCMMNY